MNKMENQTLSDPVCAAYMNSESEAVFELAVTQAVNEILSALGENTKQAIYGRLKNRYGLCKEDIPVKIDAFAKAIEETFGVVGKLIEIKIIERLHEQYSDFRYSPKNGQLDFVEYVTNLQSCLDLKA
jgi:hypothetical protein